MLPMKNARMFLLILTATLYTASAQTAFTVNGKANIYAAGQSVAPDGELPYEIDFNPQEAQAVEFSSVTGTVSNGSANGGPDGSLWNGDPNVVGIMIESSNNLSTIAFLKRFAFMTGVFLGASAAAPPAPHGLIFTNADQFETLSPLVAQTFFIGDGLTGTGNGATQIFVIPEGASRLFIGIADACNVKSFARPSCYFDNSGSFTGKITFPSKANGTWSPVDSAAAIVHAAAH